MNRFENQLYYWTHMLDESFNKDLLLEDKEGKNINKAEKWIKQNHPEVIGQTLDNGTTITPRILTQEIRNTMPNVRMADCKFLVGVTRLYFENQADSEIQSKFNTLNKMLNIICTAHVDEYDNDLNGLSFDELNQKFSEAMQKELDSDKEEINKLVLLKKQDYEIVTIDSFKQAEKYGKYTNWCVTHDADSFDSYTKNGLGRFYFCLKPSFQNIMQVEGDGCPMDEYGKSMIAISVNDDGSLNTCTCRWNHDHGGNDNMMDTKQISEFFGLNFYKTFVPYPVEELLKKYEKIRVEDDEISKTLNAVKCKDKDEYVPFYVKIEDGRIVKYKPVSGSCLIDPRKQFWHVENGQLKKGTPQTVDETFDCSRNQLTSLEGAPSEVGGDFICNRNRLTSLEGSPFKIGGSFFCGRNQLTSLEGAPSEVGRHFDCSRNQLTSLEGAPSKIVGDFGCDSNRLTSLKGAPSKVGGVFNCSLNQLTSLEGAPSEVGGSFHCNCNQLTSLKGAPSKVGGFFLYTGNQITPEQIDDYIAFLENPTPDLMDETGHYKPKDEQLNESRTYSRRQILEAIRYWEKQLKRRLD